MEGWVRRRADLRQWIWRTRYLALDPRTGLLHYFGKESDRRPRRSYLVHSGCTVTDPVNKDGGDKEGSFWAFKLYLTKPSREATDVQHQHQQQGQQVDATEAPGDMEPPSEAEDRQEPQPAREEDAWPKAKDTRASGSRTLSDLNSASESQLQSGGRSHGQSPVAAPDGNDSDLLESQQEAPASRRRSSSAHSFHSCLEAPEPMHQHSHHHTRPPQPASPLSGQKQQRDNQHEATTPPQLSRQQDSAAAACTGFSGSGSGAEDAQRPSPSQSPLVMQPGTTSPIVPSSMHGSKSGKESLSRSSEEEQQQQQQQQQQQHEGDSRADGAGDSAQGEERAARQQPSISLLDNPGPTTPSDVGVGGSKQKPKVYKSAAVLELGVNSREEANKWVRALRTAMARKASKVGVPVDGGGDYPSQPGSKQKKKRRARFLRRPRAVTIPGGKAGKGNGGSAHEVSGAQDGYMDEEDEDEEEGVRRNNADKPAVANGESPSSSSTKHRTGGHRNHGSFTDATSATGLDDDDDDDDDGDDGSGRGSMRDLYTAMEDLGSVPEQLQDIIDHRNDEFPLRGVNVVVHDVIAGLTVYREVDEVPSVAQYHATTVAGNELTIRRMAALFIVLFSFYLLLEHGASIVSATALLGAATAVYWLLIAGPSRLQPSGGGGGVVSGRTAPGAISGSGRGSNPSAIHRQQRNRIPVYVAGHSVRGTPKEVHAAVMSVRDGRVLWDGANISVTVLERQDQHVDIVHMVQKPVFRWPFWCQPRDCVCLRYWAREADGSYVVVLQSTEHPAAPPRRGTVRADVLQWTFLICPMKPEYAERDHIVRYSYVVETVQYNPNFFTRWRLLPKVNPFLFIRPMMTNLLSLAEYMASRDFVDAVNRGRIAADISEFPTHARVGDIDQGHSGQGEAAAGAAGAGGTVGTGQPADGTGEGGGDGKQGRAGSAADNRANGNARAARRVEGGSAAGTHHRTPSFYTAPQLPVGEDGTVHDVPLEESSSPTTEWKEPYCCKFRVRGPDYLDTRVKVTAEPALFHLVAVDKFSFEDPSEQMCIAPRSSKCKFPPNLTQRERQAQFTFVVCITPPSSRNISVVLYFRPLDPHWRQRNPRFTAQFDRFVEGDDDHRNARFKLLPDIVKGPLVLRASLRSRPAIPGKKVPISYHRGDNWFEVDIDVSKAGKAKFITSLALPIAKNIVVDLGFLIEGQDPSELPEQIIGACRFNKMDLTQLARVPKGGSVDAPYNMA